jgi:sulfur carrier protein
MQIVLNGQGAEVPAGIDVAGLLEFLGHGGKRVAVEVNGAIVPRSTHAGTRLHDGDRVELVHAMGGG